MRRVSYRSGGRQDLRRDHRREEPRLAVRINGVEFPSHDWSLGGTCLDGVPDGTMPGDSVHLQFSGVRSDYLHAGEITAEVVRIEPDRKQVAFRFVRFHDAAFDALEALMTGRKPRPDMAIRVDPAASVQPAAGSPGA